jgi:hypothetical protein
MLSSWNRTDEDGKHYNYNVVSYAPRLEGKLMPI